MNTVTIGWGLGLLLLALAGLAAAVTRWAALGSVWAPLVAAARAVAQLALVSTVIVAVLHSLILTVVFLVAMVVVAAGTSARRVTGSLRLSGWWTALPIAGAVAPALGIVLASTVVPADPMAILPTAGILIGGAMTATTLAARRMGEELTAQRGAYEAALSLGLGRRAGALLVGRDAASLALVPGLDQTRTVGLVTLPGAFVGVLLAGASPWQAGAAQVLVLVALLLVQSLAVAVTVELIAAGRLPALKARLPQ